MEKIAKQDLFIPIIIHYEIGRENGKWGGGK